MGCQMNAWLDTSADGASLLQQVPAWVEEAEQAFSRFRPTSELSQLNQHIGQWTTVSVPMFEVIQMAKNMARLTDGLYNPLILNALAASGYDRSFDQMQTVAQPATAPAVADWHEIQLKAREQSIYLPAEIDLGGIAKGWTAQWVTQRLSNYGACMVDAGGDIVAHGKPDGWLVAISDPFAHDHADPIATVQINDCAIVTSGIDYRRWMQGEELRHHLIDPRTGQSAMTDVLSTTIIHPDAPTAEAYAKAVMLLGTDQGLDWLRQQWYGTGLVVRQDGAVLMTTNMESYFRRLS
jgi:thiamine biosynthesis lipoprotein